RIRKIPGMAITTRTKLRNIRTATIGFEGEHVQTIKFRRSERSVLLANWDAGQRLVSNATNLAEVRGSRVATGVPASSIVQFLDEYQIEEGRTLQSKFLKDYIQSLEATDPAARLWNV